MKSRRIRGKAERASSESATFQLSWQEIGRFAESLRNAQRELLSGVNLIRDEFSLGPHGTWIVGLIAIDRVRTQSDVVKRYGIGRSIIAEEIALLSKSGLVKATKNVLDRRHVDLELTPLGVAVNQRIAESLAARVQERLGERYSLSDLHFCTELLHALGGKSSWMEDDSPL